MSPGRRPNRIGSFSPERDDHPNNTRQADEDEHPPEVHVWIPRRSAISRPTAASSSGRNNWLASGNRLAVFYRDVVTIHLGQSLQRLFQLQSLVGGEPFAHPPNACRESPRSGDRARQAHVRIPVRSDGPAANWLRVEPRSRGNSDSSSSAVCFGAALRKYARAFRSAPFLPAQANALWPARKLASAHPGSARCGDGSR